MKTSLHGFYIAGSLLAAFVATAGVIIDIPFVFGILPGLIGGAMAAVAASRFLKRKTDLAGFVATVCGFVFYQAFQTNPITLPDFAASLATLDERDKLIGIFLGNFTTGMLLIAFQVISQVFKVPLNQFVPRSELASRASVDPIVIRGFLLVFLIVALPHVLFGKVVVGALKSIIYQRASWSSATEYSGFDVWGGAVGASLVNTAFWSTSLILIWLYLLRSRAKPMMIWTAPLVLLWTASVALQGSRTYIVMLGFAFAVYYFGSPRMGTRVFAYGVIAAPVVVLLLQMTALFRTEGLYSIDFTQLAGRLFEIRGNEGTNSQIDGLEFFRTEYLERGLAANPLVGFFRGMVERPIEGLMMPLPRSLFPWKPVDDTARDFTLFYQNVRLGVSSNETFLGASPGLMGRELIRYGIFGPLTVLFWLGLILALADKLYSTGPDSDFHRIFAATLIAFFVAQMRDWVPIWFLPFLPALLLFGYIAKHCRARRVILRRRTLERQRSVQVG